MSEGLELLPPMAALAYVGNSEKKCVMQLLVEPGEVVSARELNARFAAAQTPDDKVAYRSLNNLAQTVMSSHCKTGVFESVDRLRFSTWWTRKAEDSRVTDAVAGHMLALSSENELGLEALWGKVSTSRGKNNSPQIRTLLFGRLADLAVGDSASVGDISTDTGLARNVVQMHIAKLYERGFVEYSAIGLADQVASFALATGANPEHSTQTRRGPRVREQVHYGGQPTLRNRVGTVLASAQRKGWAEITYGQLTEKLAPEGGVNHATLQGVLGILLREGVVVRRHKSPHQGDTFSDIRLTPLQKGIIDRCIRIMSGLEGGNEDTLQEGFDCGRAIMRDPALVTQLLRKGYEQSPFTP